MLVPFRVQARRWFSTVSIAQKTFLKFQEKHKANLENFKNKINEAAKDGDQIKKSTQKVYVHPYNNSHRPIIPGHIKSLELERDLAGPEQVSPHYENFSMARRNALIFWGGFIALRFIATSQDFYVFAKSASGAWVFLFGYLYFFVEGKKSFFMPILTRFYRKIASMQMANLQNYYNENAEVRVRNLMSIAKSQIEYKMVHNQYVGVRNSSLLNFLVNEQIALKNHLSERAQSILKQAEYIELMNQQKIISSVMSETLRSIDQAYANNKQKIQSEMFKLAVEGIAKGKMDFAKDPILPYVIETINQTVKKFSSISKEEQDIMVSVTKEQIDGIRAADSRARDQFLKSEPKIDGSLKNNEIVGKILSKWGQ